jgi:hypothetical protein
LAKGCAGILDRQMRNLTCRRIQVDEIWSYVGKKQRFVTTADDASRVGDMWTFVALDADTKLIPAHRVGKRTSETAVAILTDLSERVMNRVQLSSDALTAYVDAAEQAFGADVDYGQIVKFYKAELIGPGRYSPPRVANAQRSVIMRQPRPSPYLDVLRRAPESHHADEHAPIHPAHQRVLKEGRKLARSRGTALRALQFRPHP